MIAFIGHIDWDLALTIAAGVTMAELATLFFVGVCFILTLIVDVIVG